MPLPKSAQVAQNIHNQLVAPIPRETLQLGPGQGTECILLALTLPNSLKHHCPNNWSLLG